MIVATSSVARPVPSPPSVGPQGGNGLHLGGGMQHQREAAWVPATVDYMSEELEKAQKELKEKQMCLEQVQYRLTEMEEELKWTLVVNKKRMAHLDKKMEEADARETKAIMLTKQLTKQNEMLDQQYILLMEKLNEKVLELGKAKQETADIKVKMERVFIEEKEKFEFFQWKSDRQREVYEKELQDIKKGANEKKEQQELVIICLKEQLKQYSNKLKNVEINAKNSDIRFSKEKVDLIDEADCIGKSIQDELLQYYSNIATEQLEKSMETDDSNDEFLTTVKAEHINNDYVEDNDYVNCEDTLTFGEDIDPSSTTVDIIEYKDSLDLTSAYLNSIDTEKAVDVSDIAVPNDALNLIEDKEENSDLDGKKGTKNKRNKRDSESKDCKISDMNDREGSKDGVDADDEDKKNDKDDDSGDGKNKISKNSKKINEEEAQPKELDYMNDELIDSGEDVEKEQDVKGLNQDEGLSKMLDSESSSSKEDKDKDKNDKDYEDEVRKKDDKKGGSSASSDKEEKIKENPKTNTAGNIEKELKYDIDMETPGLGLADQYVLRFWDSGVGRDLQDNGVGRDLQDSGLGRDLQDSGVGWDLRFRSLAISVQGLDGQGDRPGAETQQEARSVRQQEAGRHDLGPRCGRGDLSGETRVDRGPRLVLAGGQAEDGRDSMEGTQQQVQQGCDANEEDLPGDGFIEIELPKSYEEDQKLERNVEKESELNAKGTIEHSDINSDKEIFERDVSQQEHMGNVEKSQPVELIEIDQWKQLEQLNVQVHCEMDVMETSNLTTKHENLVEVSVEGDTIVSDEKTTVSDEKTTVSDVDTTVSEEKTEISDEETTVSDRETKGANADITVTHTEEEIDDIDYDFDR